jgi:hypothetical protein
MPKGRQGTVAIAPGTNWETTFKKGRSNFSSLQVAFATSPLYDNQGYTLDKLIEVANNVLVPKSQNQTGDLSYFPNGVDLSFTGRNQPFGPPDYNDVDTKITTGRVKDAISSPFTPTIASPGASTDGSVNLKPGETAPSAVDSVPDYGTKAALMVSPKVAAEQKAVKKIGDLLDLGKSGAPGRGTDAG